MSKKTTVLESANFHISNSGMNLRIVEQIDSRKAAVFPPDWFEGLQSGKYFPGGDPKHVPLPEVIHRNRTWRMEVRFTSFGSGVSFDFPLIPLVVKWALKAFERTLERMETPQEEPTDGVEFAFRDTTYASIGHRKGEKVDDTFPFKTKRVSYAAGGVAGVCTEVDKSKPTEG